LVQRRPKMEKRKYLDQRKFNAPKAPDNVVFGTRAVIETIKASKPIDKLLIQKGLQNELLDELLEVTREHQIAISNVPVEKLNRITLKNHQGVIAFVSAIHFVTLHNIVANSYENGSTPLILILDRVTDVRNFGAICRSAECAGVSGIVIPSKGAAMINSDAVKTSAGALNYLSICKEDHLPEALKYLKESGFQIIACTEKTEEYIYAAEMNIPTAIILGSEEDGISASLIEASDRQFKIPILGEIGSLNVSVAAGIVLYECIRQRL